MALPPLTMHSPSKIRQSQGTISLDFKKITSPGSNSSFLIVANKLSLSLSKYFLLTFISSNSPSIDLSLYCKFDVMLLAIKYSNKNIPRTMAYLKAKEI